MLFFRKQKNSTKMKKPYIGITGFTSDNQINPILVNRNISPEFAKRLLMVGVSVNPETLQGIQSPAPRRYPKMKVIDSIFSDDPRCLNLVHLSIYDRNDLFHDMVSITKKFTKNFHGFHLNVVWPDLIHLEKYKTLYPDMTIGLGIGHSSIKDSDWSCEKIFKDVESYGGFLDYVFIDVDKETKDFFSNGVLELLLKKLSKLDYLNLGISGDFDSSDVQRRLLSLVQTFPHLSINAGSALRTGEDDLDVNEVRKYLEASIVLLKDF